MELKVKINTPYTVSIGSGKIVELKDLIKGYNRAIIVIDSTVNKLYKKKVLTAVDKKAVDTFIFRNGEKGKNVKTLTLILEKLNELNFTKKDVIISIGGGAVLDTSGFAAAIFKRGVPYINIPTTLLSMIDASVGGKTAIDAFNLKNNIGVIYQPKAVIIDTDFLTSLPKKEMSNGLSEALKCGVIGSPKLYKILSKDNYKIEDVIYLALKVKIKLVEKDENDFGERRLLNLGHTVGHAIESLSGYKIPHGSAVASGMLFSAKVSEKFGKPKTAYQDIKKCLDKLGIKYQTEIDGKVFDYILKDKKAEGDIINFVLPNKIGKCRIEPISVKRLKGIINEG